MASSTGDKRFEFIEPNKYASMAQNGDYSYSNVSFNAEDMCISVDLTVRVPDRNGCGYVEDGTSIDISDSMGRKKVSFMEGTDGSLTDGYSTMVFSDIMNPEGKADRECLGIKDINITYNSYFYPEVVMNLIDVRGNSLMNPNEAEYVRKVTGAGGVDSGLPAQENFFSALFSFPYPTFYLTVKGFYGPPVRYNLVVSDFRSSFNASSGNFEASVKFIGQMYGIYTDIPMKYIIAAPYCMYGAENGVSVWDRENYTFPDGVKIPTFPELKRKILKGHNNLPQSITQSETEMYTALYRKKEMLNEVCGMYSSFFKNLGVYDDEGNGTGYSESDMIRTAVKGMDCLLVILRNSLSEGDISYDIEGFRNLMSKISEFNEAYPETPLKYPNSYGNIPEVDDEYVMGFYRQVRITMKMIPEYQDYLNSEDKADKDRIMSDISGIISDAIGKNRKRIFGSSECFKSKSSGSVPISPGEFMNDGSLDTVSGGSRGFYGIDDIIRIAYPDSYVQFSKKVLDMAFGNLSSETCGKRWSVTSYYGDPNMMLETYMFIFNGMAFVESAIAARKEVDGMIEKFNKNIENRYNDTLKSIIGYVPSIKNMINVIMAHMNCFMKIYHIFMDTVKNSDRDAASMGVDIRDTDIPSGGETSMFVPPFPLIKSSDNTMVYPSEVPGLSDMEETRFVESFLAGIKGLAEDERRTESDVDTFMSEDLRMMPSNITDFTNQINPYESLFTERIPNGSGVDEIYSLFGLRAEANRNEKSSLTAEEFGRCEAYNFWRSHKYITEGVRMMITNSSFCSDDYISYVTKKGKSKYNTTREPVYQVPPLKNNGIVTVRYGSSSTVNYAPIINGPIGYWKNNMISYQKDGYTEGNIFHSGVVRVARPDRGMDAERCVFGRRFTKDTYQCTHQTSVNTRNYKYISDWIDKIGSVPIEGIQDIKNKIISETGLYSLPVFRAGNISHVITAPSSGHSEVKGRNCIAMTSDFGQNSGYKNIEDVWKLSGDKFEVASLSVGGYSYGMFLHPVFSDIDRLGINEDSKDMLRAYLFLGLIGMGIENMPASEGSFYPKAAFYPRILQLWFGALSAEERGMIPDELYSLEHLDYRYIRNILEFSTQPDGSPESNRTEMIRKIEMKFKKDEIEYLLGYGLHIIPSMLKRGDEYIVNEKDTIVFSDQYMLPKHINRSRMSMEFAKWVRSYEIGGFQHIKKHLFIDSSKNIFHGGSIKDAVNTIAKIYGYGYFAPTESLSDRIVKDVPESWRAYLNKGTIKPKYDESMDDYIMYASALVALGLPQKWFEKPGRDFEPGLKIPFRGLMNAVTSNEYTRKFEQVRIGKNSVMFMPVQGNVGLESVKRLLTDRFFMTVPFVTSYEFSQDINSYKVFHMTAFDSFKKGLMDMYKVNETDKNENVPATDVRKDIKLSCYADMKNLYDRWMCDDDIARWSLGTGGYGEMGRFHYVDSFYNDIGDSLYIGEKQIASVIDVVFNTDDSLGRGSDLSVYSFISLLCQRSNMLFMALPVFMGGSGNIAEMLRSAFTPYSFGEASGMGGHVGIADSGDRLWEEGPSYICLYPHKPSEHLDINGSQYPNDGFNLSDPYMTGDDMDDTSENYGREDLPLDMVSSVSEYRIPAFGVNFGTQNQNIFKSINVNMDNPKVTEYSVAAQFSIASMNSNEPRKVSFDGQDLYKVYSNHSYTCTVEMMGCAQIQPLMFFQLNNVPLFRGAYMIIKVEHSITSGNMVTRFTGVRMNKNKIPMVKSAVDISDILDRIGSGETVLGTSPMAVNGPHDISYTRPSASRMSSEKGYMYRDFMDAECEFSIANITAFTDWVEKTDGEGNTVMVKAGHTQEEINELAFNALNPELRKVMFDIMKNAYENDGIRLVVTSCTRTRDELTDRISSSDHFIPSSNSTRKSLGLDNMGCAIDFKGYSIEGGQDKSINLFNMISNEYYDYIRQLIWEKKENDPSDTDLISHCIHFSSYGKGRNDKTQIFVSVGKWNPKKKFTEYNSVNARMDRTGDVVSKPSNIPESFLKIMNETCDTNGVSGIKAVFTNFKNSECSDSDINMNLNTWTA